MFPELSRRNTPPKATSMHSPHPCPTLSPAMALSPDSRTGVAAILAGVLIFAGQAGELAFGEVPMGKPRSGSRSPASESRLLSRRSGAWAASPARRIGRIGWRISVAGVVFLGLFNVQALVTVALTGDIPDNFVLFGLGFLLLFVGHLLIASGLRDALGRAWILPLVGAAGILVAITLDVDPLPGPSTHDIGLFVFEGAWVALGFALLHTEHRRQPDTASALV